MKGTNVQISGLSLSLQDEDGEGSRIDQNALKQLGESTALPFTINHFLTTNLLFLYKK